MHATTKLVLSVLATASIFLIVRHGATALGPAVPKDMPSDSRFVQSGYDLQRNEPEGDWISCSTTSPYGHDADYCRVTDNHGTVIFQGDFMPVRGSQPVAPGRLQVAAMDADKLWVEGPAEESPVPVITLTNGAILVPADDSDALADRWARDPQELARVESR